MKTNDLQSTLHDVNENKVVTRLTRLLRRARGGTCSLRGRSLSQGPDGPVQVGSATMDWISASRLHANKLRENNECGERDSIPNHASTRHGVRRLPAGILPFGGSAG